MATGDADGTHVPVDVLARLEAVIAARRSSTADASYTKSLLDAGAAKCAKKLGEEGVECALAVAGEPHEAVVNEAADVLFHLLVALAARDVPFSEVTACLDGRMGVSGHVEKASRGPASQ